MDTKEKLGKRIRLLRDARGLTQEKLAEQADLSVTFIGAVERGKNIPSITRCGRIAEVLGVPLNELFRFEDQTKRDQEIEKFAARLKAEKNRKKVKTILEIGEVVLKNK